MLKCLFAEDERAAREGIVACIDWQALGLTVRTARNGVEAFGIAQQDPPDILLTDIRMPMMDGLELAGKVQALNPRCSILIISSYSEVDYLKQVIALHAVDFVEKPVEIPRLEKRLKDAVEIQRAQYRQRALVAENVLSALTYPMPMAEDTLQLLHQVLSDVSLETPCRSLLVRIVSEEGRSVSDSRLFQTVRQIRATLQTVDTRILCGLWDDFIHIALIGEETIGRVPPESLHQMLQAGRRESVYLSAGDPEPLSDYHASLRQAQKRMDGCFYQEALRVMTADPLSGKAPCIPLEDFATALRSGDRVRAFECIQATVDAIAASAAPSPRKVSEQLGRMLMLVLEDQSDSQTAADWLRESVFLTNMAEDLRKETERYFEQHSTPAPSTRMRQIAQYIREHYADPELSLHRLSEMFYLSDAYLCVKFKEAMGTTVGRFIIECRMQKAANLLTGTDLLVSDVARAVGLEDSGYFTRLFRKEKGVSPMAYRKLPEEE